MIEITTQNKNLNKEIHEQYQRLIQVLNQNIILELQFVPKFQSKDYKVKLITKDKSTLIHLFNNPKIRVRDAKVDFSKE